MFPIFSRSQKIEQGIRTGDGSLSCKRKEQAVAIGVDLASFISDLMMDSIFNYNNGHLWGYDDKKS